MKILAAPIAFNEEKKIGSVCDRLNEAAVDKRVLLDDASTDGTSEVARQKGFEVIRQPERRGVGAGIRTVIRYAEKNGFDIVVIMAGNDKDRPHEIPLLTGPIEHGGFDLVQGSRYLPGGSSGNTPLYRQIATRWVHPVLMSLVTGQRLTDTTNGFRAIRVSVFKDKRIHLDQDWLNQYELEPYILFKLIRLGFKVKEAPVTKIYPPKSLGYTKMKPVTGWWSILRPIFLLGLGLKK
jgi:dolichol-phosphate mannosyltransferase